jgi:hypothetical protein
MIYLHVLLDLLLTRADPVLFSELAMNLYNKINVIALKFPSVLCPIKNSATAVQDIVTPYSRSEDLIPDTKLFTINAIPVM